MSEKKIDEQWIERIVQSLQGIEYGSVEIVIHDSQITQIDRLEKQRFPLKKNQVFQAAKQAKAQ
ncbi:YezD family protein [Domibacillus enclensis]|uniref:DUF2292 domain-containing protein n=1 Tax=Domibacillus enclensis TaxID=1017273 RepID=A0A1N7A4E8_9BACI|nr:YezD family protein [Domibacillus enclensis]OXS75694.1 DUF2292 domain-containing protein [Domibacillus enclensis]SIR33957.1 hypothetical protein SAMN05443094_10766 [Domibacillus enclensis]